jgi:hypothetical protein
VFWMMSGFCASAEPEAMVIRRMLVVSFMRFP